MAVLGRATSAEAGGGNPVEAPPFDATVRAALADTFKYPLYIQSKNYDGWCEKGDVEKR